MKRVKAYKGFIIALDKENRYQLFTKEEWIMGAGCRYPEHDTCSIEEAIQFIDCY
jgi:hypothetical protein